MNNFTGSKPEGLEHGPWERERLRLLAERYLHITDEGQERWFDTPRPLCLRVAVVRVPERGNEYWLWARTGSAASELMRRIPARTGWVISSQCAGCDLWTRAAMAGRQ